MAGELRILVLEAYDGGSHGQFLDGLIAHSRHEYVRVGMPPRKWKWRMRGSALYFAEQLAGGDSRPGADKACDVIFTSDMTAVADLRALLPKHLARCPIVCYFHENQLTYPVPDEADRDYQYGFTNITSCLAADAVYFNSAYHRETFLTAVDELLRRMPDFVPSNVSAAIAAKSCVMPLGLNDDVYHPPTVEASNGGPTILWNHRWEFDKNPDLFFETLFDLQRGGVPFRLIVAGEQFRTCPPIFHAAEKILADRIDHFGYAASRADYCELLRRADIVVSTSIHEFFGLSVLEGLAAGCYPLVPNRLSYPDLLPHASHAQHVYARDTDLPQSLGELCLHWPQAIHASLNNFIGTLSWTQLAPQYDRLFEQHAGDGNSAAK